MFYQLPLNAFSFHSSKLIICCCKESLISLPIAKLFKRSPLYHIYASLKKWELFKWKKSGTDNLNYIYLYLYIYIYFLPIFYICIWVNSLFNNVEQTKNKSKSGMHIFRSISRYIWKVIFARECNPLVSAGIFTLLFLVMFSNTASQVTLKDMLLFRVWLYNSDNLWAVETFF